MTEATVRTFSPCDGDAPLKLDKIELHRLFETDTAGLTTIHVWITAEATPADDAFESIAADVVFVLLQGDDELGTCASGALSFAKPETADKPKTVAIKADSDLRLALSADVTRIVARFDVVTTRHTAAEQRFEMA